MTEPKYCPFACGETLIVKQMTQQIVIDSLPNDANLDETFGILCQKCGYATIIVGIKKKG